MSATSVTGKGLGSAGVNQKGSEHAYLGVEKLVGPRIVVADEVTLDGSGDATVMLPALSGVRGDYTVLATDMDATAAAAVAAELTVAVASTTVVLKGPASGLVSYAIIKKGMAL